MATLQRGRKAIAPPPPTIGPIVEITRADLAHLTVKRDPTVLQSIRDSHHRLARAIALGMSNAEVADVCGCSITQVSRMRGDPMMRQLVAEKRSMIDAEFAQAGDVVVEYMRSNALKAQAMLSDKIDHALDSGEFLPTRDLLGIAELGLDRTGYGKQTKNLNVNVDFAARLEAAISKSATAPAMRVVGASPPVPLAPTMGEVQSTALQRLAPPPPPQRMLRRV